MNMAHKKNLDKAYNSPQNRGIAQSFRYMRNKPTIIAFKTPSLESFEASKDVAENGELSKMKVYTNNKNNFYPKDVEMNGSQAAEEGKVHKAVNFPVGKPLQVNLVDLIILLVSKHA